MFFWLFMAALFGLIMYGNLQEQTKDEEFYVQPVYEALGATMHKFHNAAVFGYEAAVRTDQDAVARYYTNFDVSTGALPLITVENGEYTDGAKDPFVQPNVFKNHIEAFLPLTFKKSNANGTRSYLFCLSSENGLPTGCDLTDAVHYVVTYREIPPRYEGADKYLALRALSKSTDGSRQIGILTRASEALAAGDNVYHQPIGAQYYIMTYGSEPTTANYVPNFVICNAPPTNATTGVESIGKYFGPKNYLIAVSIMRGLEHNANYNDTACSPVGVEGD